MCELFGMSARFPADVGRSLAMLQTHGAPPRGKHRDGWGIAFFDGPDTRLIREPVAAGLSSCMEFLQKHRVATTTALAHLRLATQGGVALRNTQPFGREMGGRSHVFVHNGDLPGIDRVRALEPTVFRPIGDTDSEHAFCALLGHLRPLWSHSDSIPPLESRLEVVADFARTLRALGPANFLYSDSDVVFVHGHRRTQAPGRIAPPGLVTLARSCTVEDTDGHPQRQEVVLVASVPLSDESWEPMPEGVILALADGRIVARRDPAD